MNIDFNTRIVYGGENKAVQNAAAILRRDIAKCFIPHESEPTEIILRDDASLSDEEYRIEAEKCITVYADSELGFVYGLLYISEKFLGIKPFWFWMDQPIKHRDNVSVSGTFVSPKPAVKYRGWFVNDEILIMKWSINGDATEPWRMVFEALLRCGGNMVIPGTDKNSKRYRQLASDMGLWITHHHAEPLGAEMFARVYPDKKPNYLETPELFHKLWEDAAIEQKDMKVLWCLGFRGQGDKPFWADDTSGRFVTPEAQGALISEVIKTQREMISKHVKDPVFCTNLYGEVSELYDEGHITLDDDIIKICADNGYGKMVVRRRNNHTVRIPSLPEGGMTRGGIYYHVSFYDLQAANHITMLPNTVDFVNRELDNAIAHNAADYWLINCSNVKPHAYFLDAIRKKWYGEVIEDTKHSLEFADDYYRSDKDIAKLYREYASVMVAYGSEEDERAGEQLYTENVRLLINVFFKGYMEGTPGLNWLFGPHELDEQVRLLTELCAKDIDKLEAYYTRCLTFSLSLAEDKRHSFDAGIKLQAGIHYFCRLGVMAFGKGYALMRKKKYREAFVSLGDSAEYFYKANDLMRSSEYGVWEGFYANECFADVKFTGYMAEKLMGYVRELGDNARHDAWYRELMFDENDRQIVTLLIEDNHMTDKELYRAMKTRNL